MSIEADSLPGLYAEFFAKCERRHRLRFDLARAALGANDADLIALNARIGDMDCAIKHLSGRICAADPEPGEAPG